MPSWLPRGTLPSNSAIEPYARQCARSSTAIVRISPWRCRRTFLFTLRLALLMFVTFSEGNSTRVPAGWNGMPVSTRTTMTSTSTASDYDEAAIFQAHLATGALLNPLFLLPLTGTHGTAISRCAAAQPASRSSRGTRDHSRVTSSRRSSLEGAGFSHHPSPQHKFLVAEAYHCAVLFNHRGGRTSVALPCLFLHRTTPSGHSKVWLLGHVSGDSWTAFLAISRS